MVVPHRGRQWRNTAPVTRLMNPRGVATSTNCGPRSAGPLFQFILATTVHVAIRVSSCGTSPKGSQEPRAVEMVRDLNLAEKLRFC